MAELLLTQDVYNQPPANPDVPLAPAEMLGVAAENPGDTAMMNRLTAAAQSAAAAKQVVEGGVGRGVGHRSDQLKAALEALGQTVEDANAGPDRTNFDRLSGHLTALQAVGNLQSAEHGETQGRAGRVLSAIGGSAVMQNIAKHAPAWTRVYRGVGIGLAAAGAAATVATGGVAAIPGVAIGAGIRAARGAVTGALVGAGAERAARHHRNSSEAITSRNAEQSQAMNTFMLTQIKRIVGRPEDEHLSTDELTAHVNTMVSDQYKELRTSLINSVVETSRQVGDQNTESRRRAALRGARKGAIGGIAAGGADELVKNIVPGVEHLLGHNKAGAAQANVAPTTTTGTPTTEQIQSAVQTAQEHSNGLMEHASANYPDQGTLWATVQDHGAGQGIEHLSDTATENQILSGYGTMHAQGFDVNTSGLTLNPDTSSYVPNSNDWWATVDAPKGGTWLVDGNTTDYIPGGSPLGNSQMAAIMDATQHGAHFETPAAFQQDIVSQLAHTNALDHLNNPGVSSVASVSPSAGQAFESQLDFVNSPGSWLEDASVGAVGASVDAIASVDRARTEVTEQTAARNTNYETARTDALGVMNTIVATHGSLAERTNAFAEEVFSHDSQVARFLVDARARGLTAENQAEQELLTALGLTTLTPEQLRQYLGETFNYRRELDELSIDLAGGNAGATLGNVDITSPDAVTRLNDLVPLIPDAVSNVLNENNTINQRLFLNALRIDNLDVPTMRERIARSDADQLALRFTRRRGGVLGDTDDENEIAQRITNFYENDFLDPTNPRRRMLLDVGNGTDVLTPIVSALHINEAGGNPINPQNLNQEIRYRGDLRHVSYELSQAGGTRGVLADVDITTPEAVARLTNLMPILSMSASAANTALSSDDRIHQELLLRALRIDNLDVPTMRERIATHDRDEAVAQFTASRGGALVDTAGDPTERDARIAEFYNGLRNNPRRRMLLDIDSTNAALLTPVVSALSITDLSGGGLTEEQELHRELSIRDVTQDLEPGSALRPSTWVSDLLPTDADFGVNVVDRLQDLRSSVSAGERVAIERWQSGESILSLLNIRVNTRDAAEMAAFWAAVEAEYSTPAAPVTVTGWEEVISNLPARP